MNAKQTSKSASAGTLKLFDDFAVKVGEVRGDGVDAADGVSSTAARKNAVPKSKSVARAASPAARQAFLPGLSRRGRPRSPNPVTAVQRTAEHRKKRLAEGARRVEMILAPDVAIALDALATHYSEPRSDVVAGLILKAAARVLHRARAALEEPTR